MNYMDMINMVTGILNNQSWETKTHSRPEIIDTTGSVVEEHLAIEDKRGSDKVREGK